MDFDKIVAAFQKRKRGQDMAEQKRQAYLEVLEDYQKLKFGKVVDGVRQEKPITQDRIDKMQAEKRDTSVDIADTLADFVDIEVKMPAKKAPPAKKAAAKAAAEPDPLASLLDMDIDGVKL